MSLQHIISVSGMFKSWFKNFSAELNKDVDQCFFWGRNIAKFRPEKYGFDLYKGFSMNKWAQIRQISNKKSSRSSDFNDKFH
jgi:hypothetical protein